MAEPKVIESPVPLNEVQGNVTPGFRKDHQTFLFLRFPDNANAIRAWLAGLVPCIATAHQVATFNREFRSIKERFGDASQVSRFWRSTWVNASFTAAGLNILKPEVVKALIAYNPKDAFANGMCKRLEVFRETKEILPAWRVRDSVRDDEPGDHAQLEKKVAHALIIVGAETAHDVAAEVSNQLELASRHGLSLIYLMRGQTLGGGRDHLNFRDGISQPDHDDPLKGWTWQDPEDKLGGWPIQGSEQIAPPGLIIRGCDTYESAEAGEDPPKPPAWEEFGSYLVFRRFRQDIDAFKRKVRSEADRLRNAESIRPMNENRLMAQLVGRWPSGAKVVKPIRSDDEAAATDPFPNGAASGSRAILTRNDYFPDRDGEACPMFAHVRTAFPRILLGAKKHRIVRRGITYTDDNGEKGLLFVAYQARIEDGFEFIQSRWLNRPLSPETNQVMEEPPRPVVVVGAGAASGSLGSIEPLDPLPDEDPNDFLEHERKGLDIFTAVRDTVEINMIRPVYGAGGPGDEPVNPVVGPVGGPGNPVGEPVNGAGGPVGDPGHDPAAAPKKVVNVKLDRLITIEGGGYFFSPSISGMKSIAGL